jgi:hypothetical protein
VLSLSKHERPQESPFDVLRANGWMGRYGHYRPLYFLIAIKCSLKVRENTCDPSARAT